MSQPIRFSLNGQAEDVLDVDLHTTLLSYLRQRGLTGCKEGCAEGECGACSVVVLQRGPAGQARYQAVNACLMLLPSLHGLELYTVEGLGTEANHPVQRLLMQEGGSQCGYCTPGFVMSLFAHYYSTPREPVERALSGNLCRCTGYRPIRDAARALPQVSEDDLFQRHLDAQVEARVPLHYAAGEADFRMPTRLEEALALRAADPEAQVIAGGTDVVVGVNQDRTRRARWLSLEAVEELRCFAQTNAGFRLGAGLPLADLEALLAGHIPLLAQLFPLFASQPIRTRATLGGNLGTASPVGDAAPVLLALDAEIELSSMRGSRRLALEDFITGYRRTALAADELIVTVHVPQTVPTLARFFKVSKRVLDDISCVSAAFALTLEGGLIQKARLAFGGVADRPMRAHAAETALLGRAWDEAALEAGKAALRGAFTPLSDARGSAAYRAALLESLLEKFYWEGRS